MGITLCDESDIKARLQLGDSDTLTDEQQKAWPPLAEEATTLVEGFLGREWVVDDTLDPPQTESDLLATVPRGVRVVVSRMTVRAMTAPKAGGGTPIDGQQSSSSTFGPMSYARGYSTDVFSSPWLSKSDREALRRYVVRGQIQHVAMFDDSYNRNRWNPRQRLGPRWPFGNWGRW
jgi:hypothetical protein